LLADLDKGAILALATVMVVDLTAVTKFADEAQDPDLRWPLTDGSGELTIDWSVGCKNSVSSFGRTRVLYEAFFSLRVFIHLEKGSWTDREDVTVS
jgi:hypothetical protein